MSKKKKKLIEEECQEYWESLTISNDFIFSKVMRDEDICKDVIEVLLDTKISKIKYIEEQKVIDIKYDNKSIRLDVFVEDSDRIFNLEIQTSNTDNLRKRTRYYQGLIDLNSIEKGELYKDLKESYVIFICTFDLFSKGLPVYTFENICRENSLIKLEDESYKVFFNARSHDKVHNQNLKLFLKYVVGETDDISEDDINNNIFIKKINNKIKDIKINKEWRREFMTLLMREQEIAEENFIEGKIEGKIEEKLEIAKNLLDILDNITIALKTGLSIEQVEILRKEQD